MKIHLYLLAAFLGIVLAVHLGMNGKVGAALNNARVGNAVFWCIGAITALLIGLSGWKTGALDGLKTVNPMMLTAGAMGACLVFGIAWLFPQLGGAPTMLTLIGGQIVAGLVLSHFGLLGSPVQKISLMQIGGTAAMFVGVVMVMYGNTPANK